MNINSCLKIYELHNVDCDYVEPIKKLLMQLSSSPINFTSETLRGIVESPCSHLFIAEIDGNVCGMLTLACYQSPTGRKMWIEDVVVDVSMRGHSIGRCLVNAAIGRAKEIGGMLMLTSRPSRVAANALYNSAGFEPKETNVYKMNV